MTAILGASADQHDYLYAENGYWYDSVNAVSKLIEADPMNKTLKIRRSSLLTQVNLPSAAAFDRK